MLKIAVAVVTYGRPKHLEALLESLLHLEGIAQHDVGFLVIDNDHEQSAKDVVLEMQGKDGRFIYVCEPSKGIPVARNRGLDEALNLRMDVLCFVDDDEVVDPHWLEELVKTYRLGGVQMVSGPVMVASLTVKTSRWQRFVHASLVARSRRKALQTEQSAKSGDKFTIVTNNWLADLSWLKAKGLRFDEEGFRYSGGSDTAFYRAFKSAGGLGAWNPNAVVYETVMLERLSLFYQLKRGRAQSSNHYRMKHARLSPLLILSTGLIAFVRSVLGVALLVVPVFGIASPVIAVRSIGWAQGRIDGMFGTRAALYDRPETQ